MALACLLEDFDTDQDALPVEMESPQKTYEEGFQDGIEATKSAWERSNKRALEDIAQMFSDIDIGFQEARLSVLSSLSPLISVICDQLLPELVSESLAPQLAEMIHDAAEQELTEIGISVSPDDFAALQERFIPPEGTVLKLFSEADLEPGQALFQTKSQECLLDTQRAHRLIRDALQSIVHDAGKGQING